MASIQILEEQPINLNNLLNQPHTFAIMSLHCTYLLFSTPHLIGNAGRACFTHGVINPSVHYQLDPVASSISRNKLNDPHQYHLLTHSISRPPTRQAICHCPRHRLQPRRFSGCSRPSLRRHLQPRPSRQLQGGVRQVKGGCICCRSMGNLPCW